MDAAAPPFIVPTGGAPALAVTPQLPHSADPGTITGWLLLESTTTETLDSISRGFEVGFDRLVNNIQDIHNVGYDAIMQDMAAKIINNDTVVTYLVMTNICNSVEYE